MGFLKKIVGKTIVGKALGLDDKKKRPVAAVDPDPINPLTGRPRSQDMPQEPAAQPMPPVGLGQMPYLPPPVSMQQSVLQGLGSNVFRSTLAPLQQQGYGLGQIDPRLLQSSVRLPGGQVPPWMMQ